MVVRCSTWLGRDSQPTCWRDNYWSRVVENRSQTSTLGSFQRKWLFGVLHWQSIYYDPWNWSVYAHAQPKAKAASSSLRSFSRHRNAKGRAHKNQEPHESQVAHKHRLTETWPKADCRADPLVEPGPAAVIVHPIQMRLIIQRSVQEASWNKPV